MVRYIKGTYEAATEAMRYTPFYDADLMQYDAMEKIWSLLIPRGLFHKTS